MRDIQVTPTRAGTRSTIRQALDALSAASAALGAVELIRCETIRETPTPARVERLAALAIVERNLCAALVALDGLAVGLGITLKTPREGVGE